MFEADLCACITYMYTIKLFIIGDNLFGEIKKFAKINHHQITISQFLDNPVLEIAKLILCQIVISEKPPNIITVKYYSMHQRFVSARHTCKAKQNNTFVSCNIGLQNRVGR